jgi:hypothetical protein
MSQAPEDEACSIIEALLVEVRFNVLSRYPLQERSLYPGEKTRFDNDVGLIRQAEAYIANHRPKKGLTNE